MTSRLRLIFLIIATAVFGSMSEVITQTVSSSPAKLNAISLMDDEFYVFDDINFYRGHLPKDAGREGNNNSTDSFRLSLHRHGSTLHLLSHSLPNRLGAFDESLAANVITAGVLGHGQHHRWLLICYRGPKGDIHVGQVLIDRTTMWSRMLDAPKRMYSVDLNIDHHNVDIRFITANNFLLISERHNNQQQSGSSMRLYRARPKTKFDFEVTPYTSLVMGSEHLWLVEEVQADELQTRHPNITRADLFANGMFDGQILVLLVDDQSQGQTMNVYKLVDDIANNSAMHFELVASGSTADMVRMIPPSVVLSTVLLFHGCVAMALLVLVAVSMLTNRMRDKRGHVFVRFHDGRLVEVIHKKNN